MSSTSALAAGRVAAERQMRTTCTITRATRGALDPATGKYPTTPETVYTGRCRLVMHSDAVEQRTPEGQQIAVQQPLLALPVEGTADVEVGDIALITSSPNDAALVGIRLRVAGLALRQNATARRLPVEVQT